MKLNDVIASGKKHLAILVDPDKFNPVLIEKAEKGPVSFFLVGGSKLRKNNLNKTILEIRKRSKKPVIIFPGDETQVSKNADALLLLSLISGRNPEYLIGKHVKAAKKIRTAKLDIIPTGYLLIDGQKTSTTQKITKTNALKRTNLNEIIATAMAGEQLGMKVIYLEAGSGAASSVPSSVIKSVRKNIALPLFVGGGIDNRKKAEQALKAGADCVVVGNALEKNIHLLSEIETAFL
jgi:putative glycerol-1-phosphate prenyltransferase